MIESQIAAFEFEGYASDFVEYPAGMRNFLFAAVKLHTIVSPVTVLDIQYNIFDASISSQ